MSATHVLASTRRANGGLARAGKDRAEGRAARRRRARSGDKEKSGTLTGRDGCAPRPEDGPSLSPVPRAPCPGLSCPVIRSPCSRVSCPVIRSPCLVIRSVVSRTRTRARARCRSAARDRVLIFLLLLLFLLVFLLSFFLLLSIFLPCSVLSLIPPTSSSRKTVLLLPAHPPLLLRQPRPLSPLLGERGRGWRTAVNGGQAGELRCCQVRAGPRVGLARLLPR